METDPKNTKSDPGVLKSDPFVSNLEDLDADPFSSNGLVWKIFNKLCQAIYNCNEKDTISLQRELLFLLNFYQTNKPA